MLSQMIKTDWDAETWNKNVWEDLVETENFQFDVHWSGSLNYDLEFILELIYHTKLYKTVSGPI